MSQTPLREVADPGDDYLGAFSELSQRIRAGHSFSGGERNCAFLNRGDGRFADLSFALGLDAADDGRGVALTDLDADGDVDLCLTNRTAPRLRLLRNDLQAGNRAISLRLVGDPEQGCPRDAIGARVELEVGGRILHRTVAAGSGFASQSSKLLHFGLSTGGEITGISVRWPGGGRERFTGVGDSGRYRLEQGKGGAERIDIDALATPLVPGGAPLPEPTDVARIRLSQPLKLPDSLLFTDLAGEEHRLSQLTSESPLLMNLWATWCAPCLAELAAFAELSDSGKLKVLALSVDALDDGADPGKVTKVLRGTGYRGRSGMANTELVETIEGLVLEAVYRHRGLPVPTSVLIDKGGWMTVIYKGAVANGQVLADVDKLGLGPDVARRESLPFGGRWATGHFISNPVAVAASYREGGYLDDARAYLEQFLSDHPVAPGTNVSAKRSMQLADVHFHLGELHAAQGDTRAALAQFKAAEHFSPKAGRFVARRILAVAEAGELEDAQVEASKLRAGNPASPHVLALSGDVASIAGDWRAAAEAFEATLKIDARYIPAINSLALLRATAPDPAQRDGAQAVRLAEFLMDAPGAKENPEFVSTLAAAYAESGDFERAVKTMADAERLARRTLGAKAAAAYAQKVASLRAGRPLRAGKSAG